MARQAAQTTLSDGTPGPMRGAGRRFGSMTASETQYLYLLLALELLATYMLRHSFRRAHGG